MAVGDAANDAGYALVPDTGEEGKVKWGAREINRTRDYIAAIKLAIPNIWPVSKGGTGAATAAEARANLGVRSGYASPTGGTDGDVYFKIVD